MNCEAMINDIKGELTEGDWTPERMIQDFSDTVWKAVEQLNEEKFKQDEEKLHTSALEEARVEACDAIEVYLDMIDEPTPADRKTLGQIKTQINHKLNKEKKLETIDDIIQDFLKSLG